MAKQGLEEFCRAAIYYSGWVWNTYLDVNTETVDS